MSGLIISDKQRVELDRHLDSAGDLLVATEVALADAGTKRKFRDDFGRCAAYLHAEGFFDDLDALVVNGDPSGWFSREEFIADQVSDAIEWLESGNVVSTGSGLFAWFAAVAFRWALQRFLSKLVANWAFGPEGV